jgi:hypothetical protein
VKIEDLNLDVRTYNAVRRAGVTTVEELRQRMADDPDELRQGIGSGTFETVEEALAGMQESAVILENSEAHARAYYLRDDTKARLSVIEENYYAVCNNMKEMRDGKLYKELGYQNFEDCCNAEFGITRMQTYKYIRIAENLSEDFVNSSLQIGTTKLSLLAMLDEPTREAVTETVDVENTTVKELKAKISALQSDKDKLTSENADLGQKLDAAKESGEQSLRECKAYLNGKIHELENRIQELQDQPITHDMTDADAAEEIKRLKRELEDEQLKTIMLEKSAESKANRAADAVRHELTQIHETELQTLREGYEKQLAEESKKPDRSALDRAKFYALKNVFEEIVDELETLLDDLHDDPRIRYINELDNYWTDNLLYLKRDGEGAGA